MKKLLINFIVIVFFGLITFSYSKAEEFTPNLYFTDPPKFSYNKEFICFDIINGTVFVGKSEKGWVRRVDNIEKICEYFVYKDYHKEIYKNLKDYLVSAQGRRNFDYGKKYPVMDRVISHFLGKKPEKKFSNILHKKIKLEKIVIANDEKPPSNQKISTSSKEEATRNKLLTYFEGPNSKTGTICLIKYQSGKYRFQDNTPNNDLSKCTHIIKKIDDENLFMSLLKDYLNNKSSLPNNTLVSPLISNKIEINLANSKVRPLDEVLKEKYGDPKSEETKVTAKPKKKFQPKETISDDESPIIDIASVITVNDQAYTLKGKIKDKSAVYLTVDGRAVDLNKDEFEIERFSVNPDQQQKIKIVAIDEWNNKSEKTVTVKIDLSQNKVAKKYEDLKPNNIRRVKTDNNRIAIIIGIEKYQYLNNLDAKYANRDANAFRAYATRALGIPSSNVEVLVDDKATRTQILKTFKNNLRRLAGKKGKDIHIFFAGHGLASDNGEDLYILPQDGESSLLEDTAISRVELIELIQQVNPNSVTMYFDTCYSGQTRDEQLLVASLRPVRIVADEQETPDNFTIFTASDYDQTSGSIEEAKHGMFSYYLMKGLEGNADLNTDNKITNGELISYLKDNVSQEAFIQNRQQDPMFSGDPDKVLISYN